MNLRKLERVVYYTPAKMRQPTSNALVFRDATDPNQPKVKYLNKMLNVSILNKSERDMYKGMANDEFNAKDDGLIYQTSQIVPSEFGKGVSSTIDIEKGQYIAAQQVRCRKIWSLCCTARQFLLSRS